MISDDKLHALFLYVQCLLKGGNSVVHRYNKPCSRVGYLVYCLLVEAVALFSTGQIPIRLRSHCLQVAVKYGGGGNSVTVVVAVDGYFVAVLDSLFDKLRCLFHILDFKR